MSIVSSEEDLINPKPSKTQSHEESKLIDTKNGGNQAGTTSANVDFFNDRDYYKIFLETSKE